MHVVVAGGGITGLAATLALAEGGAEVTLVEPDGRLGGMLRTSDFAGRRVDEGADAFLVRVPAGLDLARRVGLGDALVHPARREARVWHDGALHPLPPHVMGVPTDLDAVAASGLLSPAGLERLGRDLTDPAPPLPDRDVSVAEAVGARLGAEALARLVDPLVAGINAGDTARQSLAAVVPQLDAACRDAHHPSLVEACRAQVARARSTGADPTAPVFAAPSDGIDLLPAAVAAAARATGRVRVELGVAAEAVEPGPRVVLSDGRTLDADGVVVATPGHRAGQLLVPVAPSTAALLAGLDHVSVAFVRLALAPGDVGHPLDGSGVLLPRDQGMETTACSWASSKWARLAPERGDGTVVLRAALGRDGGPVVTERPDPDLVARAVEDLTPVLGLRGGPTTASVHRWERAFPQYRPGHLQRIAEAEADLHVAAPTVVLAGMYLRGVGIPASIASGEAAAARLLRRSD